MPSTILLSQQSSGTTSQNVVTGVTPSLAAPTYYGLPVIGFAAETFNNNIVTIAGKTFSASFGSELRHRFGTAVR